MSIRFLHCADIHLGYQQYNSDERYNDFGRAFEHLVDDALERRVRFLLLAGDLFHKRIVDPLTLLQASAGLQRLREAGIPVYAVEGNHERPHYRERLSWLDYLTEAGLLITLCPRYEGGQLLLEPWDLDTRSGAYVDLPEGIRILGAKYYGAVTPRVVRDMTAALQALPGPRPAYTILMLHAGLEGILDNYSATLRRADLDPLRPLVDYLALGHIHKPFVQDNWIHNPGSLETNSVAEAAWEERGYFVVEVEPHAARKHRVERVCPPRRPFVRLSFAVDTYETPQALLDAVEAFLKEQAEPALVAQRPVVELRLHGILPFERLDLDTTHIERLLKAAFDPLVVLIRDLSTPSAFEIRTTEAMSRAELERHVLTELLERDIRRREDSARWADMVLRLKTLALGSRPPEEIAAELRRFRQEQEGATC